MRRPVLYLAGLLMATGASLALAGPASAAPGDHHHNHHCNHHGDYFDNGYQGDDWYYSNSTDIDNNSNNGYYGLNILNNFLNGGGLI